ncbi:autotransporter outer membrane beta-barrel domain-containing protein [Sphingomonas sp. PR090111-T3T-6A]|uniref:autotransporter outer membrane beta-barrel domain-containing protein n=1 Tax=Sphingomonas sp. PR090111-T3T-6A TaxID=685778 RepID=UPI00038075E5|nr:autotransporter outer membrane beta-barrel domain-containing protein [Sphingomonas sp. PR090111-T3T-6A]
MRSLFATTCLTPIAFGLFATSAASAANPVATISASQTTPVLTATAGTGGTPADISITSAGSISPTTSGAAVTINSNNAVTNAGTISYNGVNNAAGILANAGVSGGITNSGTITVSETYTRTDTNGDGVLDGPFAQGSGRYGIRTAGAFTGDVTSSGAINIEGNDSAAISLDGPLTGSLAQSGSIGVTGDRTVGIRAGNVSGNVTLNGAIGTVGLNSSAVLLNGDIGGALVVQGSMTSTGYSSITLPTDVTKLTPDNLLQGGPTMQIAGNVAGGALFTAASSTTDSSGNTVTTTTASLTSYGSAPALLIGASDHGITLGAVASDADKHGLVINGNVSGLGIYDSVAANGLVIGGQGGTVNIANGMTIGGTVAATANNASATAVHIGSGATVPQVKVSGQIAASGGGKNGGAATALQIDAGASVQSIVNSGVIQANALDSSASATAILDKSGQVTSVTNSGTIAAAGGANGQNVAIDLSASSSAVTITQPVAASGVAAPAIKGDVRFGSGNDSFVVADGTVAGNTSFGAGNNSLTISGDAAYTGNATFGGGTNAMSLANTSTFAGTADFGGGNGTLSISDTAGFSGTLANSSNVAVTVKGGSLKITGTGATSLASLGVSGGGTLGVNIDGTTGASTLYKVAGAASFDTGSKLALSFSDINHTVGTYAVVQAGTIAGATNLTTAGTVLPYLYKATVTANGANEIDVSVARKSATELGLNRAQAAAYDAIYAAIAADKPIGDSFLGITDASSFSHSFRSLLPDFAGGAFDTVTSGSRATARMLADPDAPVADEDSWAFWIQQVGWGRTKAISDTAGYHINGWGASGGAEIKAGELGRFGVSVAYLAGNDDDSGTTNEVNSNQYEVAAYWRADWGGLHAFARGSWGTIDFKSHRRFDGMDGSDKVLRNAEGKWNGKLYSGTAGLSYKLQLGSFSLRPQASVDYYHLHEGHYAEDGGGVGMDLIVDGRTSDELAANGSVALGYNFFDLTEDEGGFLRAEIEGGRRQLVGGSLGSTTAHFTGGQDFTLTPEDRTSGWTGAFRLKGGTRGYTISGEFSGEQQQNRVSVALRAGLQIGF